MKEDLIKYVMKEADEHFHDDFPIQNIEIWIKSFFDQYQPERSKREDLQYCTCCGEKVYCRNCNHEDTSCKKCKMRCSEHGSNVVRDK